MRDLAIPQIKFPPEFLPLRQLEVWITFSKKHNFFRQQQSSKLKINDTVVIKGFQQYNIACFEFLKNKNKIK